MEQLLFFTRELRPIVQHALDAKEHIPSFEEMTDPRYLKDGETMPDRGYASGEQIDRTKVGPKIKFVKDEGIYLMSNAAERDLVTANGKERSRVCYALGYNPDEDSDVWESSRRAVGGSDFALALPIEWFQPILDDESIVSFALEVSSDEIRPVWFKKGESSVHG